MKERFQCDYCGEIPIFGNCPHGCDEKHPEWTVWVGGVEMTDHYLTEAEALLVTQYYKNKGYDDAVAEKKDRS